MAANRQELDQLIEPKEKRGHVQVRVPEAADTRKMCNKWRRSVSREELTCRFKEYLSSKTAKGSAYPLKEKSQKKYFLAVFGLKHSFEQNLKATRGQHYELHHLMFRPDNTHIPMDIAIVEGSISIKEGQAAGVSLSLAVGLFHLCTYFLRAASMDPDYDRHNAEHRLHFMDFKENTGNIIDLLQEQIKVLSNESTAVAKVRKEKLAMSDPQHQEKMRTAIRKYYGSADFKKYIDRLHALAAAAEEGPPVDLKTFDECGRWLMLMVNYFNGARRQAATLLRNVHVLRKQRSSTVEEDIQLENAALDLTDVACLTVDSRNVGDDGGKTGRVELALPKCLNDATINYITAKEVWLGSLDPQEPLFVSRKGEKIKPESMYLSKTAKDVFSAMGVRVTMTQNRAFVATLMQEKGCKGKMFTLFSG